MKPSGITSDFVNGTMPTMAVTLSVGFAKRLSDAPRCTAPTTAGMCQRLGGYIELSGQRIRPALCLFHNLVSWRDPLGRYLAPSEIQK